MLFNVSIIVVVRFSRQHTLCNYFNQSIQFWVCCAPRELTVYPLALVPHQSIIMDVQQHKEIHMYLQWEDGHLVFVKHYFVFMTSHAWNSLTKKEKTRISNLANKEYVCKPYRGGS